jgi:hypothetical protein
VAEVAGSNPAVPICYAVVMLRSMLWMLLSLRTSRRESARNYVRGADRHSFAHRAVLR